MKKHQKVWIVLVAGLTAGFLVLFFISLLSGRTTAGKMDLAARHVRRGEMEQAMPLLLDAISQDRSNEMAFRLLCDIYEQRHNYLSAAVCLQQVRFLNPLDTEIRPRLAWLFWAAGRSADVRNLLQDEWDRGRLSAREQLLYLEARMMAGDREMVEEHLPPLGESDDPFLFLLYGMLALDQGEWARAIERLNQIDGMAPVALRYRAASLSAFAAIALQDEQLAEEQLILAADLLPAQGLYPLALFYLERDDREEGIRRLHQAADADPANYAAKLMLTDLYAQEQRVDRLEALLEGETPRDRAGQEYVNYLRAAIALHRNQMGEVIARLQAAPNTAYRQGHQSMLFEALVAERRVAETARAVTSFLASAADPQVVRARIQRRLYELMADLVEARRIDDADQIALAMLTVIDGADDPAAVPMLSLLLVNDPQRNRYETVMRYAARILGSDSRHPLANQAMGEALLAIGRARRALTYFEAIPNSLPSKAGQALAYIELGDLVRAEQIYRSAWEAFPGDLPLYEAYAAFLIDRGRFDEVASLSAVLPETPDAVTARELMHARAARRQDDRARAERHERAALEAVRTMEETPSSQILQAWLLAGLREVDAAADLYRNVLRDDPGNLLVLLNLAEVEAERGNHDESMRLTEEALQRYPNSPQAQEAMARRRPVPNADVP